jgi:GNAT superfamily N-acetyltransferase
MDQAAVLAAFDEQLRNTVGDDRRSERVGRVIRHLSEREDGWSGIEWSDLDETNADDVIAEQVRYFSERGRSFEWKYYAYDRPADLPERLRAAGFQPDEAEALMVADATELPEIGPPSGVHFVEASDEDALRHVQAVHDKAFGGDHGPMIESLRSQVAAGVVVPVLAMAGDTPVCAARVDFHTGTEFASLWGGGTVPEWRGRGIYRAMVSYRARLALARGYRYLRTDALPTSRPILEKLGFVQLTTTVPYTLS